MKIISYAGEKQVRMYKKPIREGPRIDIKDKKKDSRDKSKPYLEQLDPEKLFSSFEKIKRSISVSQNRAKNKVYEYARANTWEYFVTLTFDPKKVDSFDYDLVTRKLSQWLKDFKRRKAPNLRYIGVPELHESGRYHFHFLMSEIGNMGLVDSSKRDNKGRVIYNLGAYRLGWTTATEITDSAKASNYLSKYICKSLMIEQKGKKKYWASTNLDTPIVEKILLSESEYHDQWTLCEQSANCSKSVQIEEAGYSNIINYYEFKSII